MRLQRTCPTVAITFVVTEQMTIVSQGNYQTHWWKDQVGRLQLCGESLLQASELPDDIFGFRVGGSLGSAENGRKVCLVDGC